MEFVIWVFLMSYWLIIPAVFICVILILLFKAKTKAGRWSVGSVGAIGLAVMAWYILGGERMLLDAKVRELCEKDGGIKIYERVVLPAERFDKWGVVDVYQPGKGEAALGDLYTLRRESESLKQGNLRMWRAQVRIYRDTDGQLLGETVSYHRVGGDLPGLWHHSSYRCPEDVGEPELVNRIFVKSDR